MYIIYFSVILLLLFVVIFREKQEIEKDDKELLKKVKKLRSINVKLGHLNKAKSNFIQAASHQLREPLAATKAYVSMFLENSYGKISPKLRTTLEKIYTSNEKLIALIENLLNISRIEEGRLGFNFKKKDIKKLVKEITTSLTIQAKTKNLYLKFKAPKKSFPKIWIDDDKMTEAIMNILDNALKYTRRGGITVEINRVKKKVKISIRDTGIGITKDNINSIFDKFCRGDESCKMNATGTGLGLFTAHKFILAHKGKIIVKSEGKGKGATFIVELPLNLKKPPSKSYVSSAIKVQENSAS